MMAWSKAPQDRDQLVLFAHRLDEAIGPGHMARLLDEILGALDWRAWEAHYDGKRGQPPIHPRILASVLIYGLLTRIRSSRMLEQSLRQRLDFMWLVEGRSIDHTTIAKFRLHFEKELAQLFVQVCRVAREMRLTELELLGYDGTSIQANHRRHRTRTLDELAREQLELEGKVRAWIEQAESDDARDDEWFSQREPEMPPEIRDANHRSARIKQVLDRLREDQGKGHAMPSRLPTRDLDARVFPGKDGVNRPNYTATATVDIETGLVARADVLSTANEAGAMLGAIDAVREQHGLETGRAMLADTLMNTGPNLAGCAERGVTLYSPDKGPELPENPAIRDDPTQPVPEADWPKLPVRQEQKKDGGTTRQLTKDAFIYDEANDRFHCPMGKPLSFKNTTSEVNAGVRREVRRYHAQPGDCEECPLRTLCVTGKGARQIRRDQFAGHHEQHTARMKTPEAKVLYNRRRHPGERPFAMIKGMFGLRQFLLRGVDRVRNEWRWAALAFNIHRLISLITGSRDGTARR